MARTRRVFRWARCPRPLCEGRVWFNDDYEIDDADCGCDTDTDYTDDEFTLMLNNLHDTRPEREDE